MKKLICVKNFFWKGRKFWVKVLYKLLKRQCKKEGDKIKSEGEKRECKFFL